MRYAIFICLSVLISGPLHAETYKWVNEEGVVTYSQTPPPSMEAEKVKLRQSRTSSGPSSKDRLNDMRQRLEDNAEDRELNKQSQQESKEKLAIKKQNCQAARSNLQKLDGLGNRLYMKDGEYKRLSEEERQSLMQQARENIKANCRS